jgi:hypothetical protein
MSLMRALIIPMSLIWALIIPMSLTQALMTPIILMRATLILNRMQMTQERAELGSYYIHLACLLWYPLLAATR